VLLDPRRNPNRPQQAPAGRWPQAPASWRKRSCRALGIGDGRLLVACGYGDVLGALIAFADRVRNRDRDERGARRRDPDDQRERRRDDCKDRERRQCRRPGRGGRALPLRA
jgi:hypothetical protein